ncbi:MAG: hypothetical protein QM687_16810 [Ferruginibacter sp.]
MNQPKDILNELRDLSPALAAIPKTNVFSVPDGYFEHLPAILLVQATPKTEKATVPEGYFENLAGNIMSRIRQEAMADNNGHSELLAGIGNTNIFTVPGGYFEQLPGAILGRIHTGEAAQTGVLAGIGNKNVFTVPEGYFEGLSSRIMASLNNETVQDETLAVSALVAGIGNKNVFTVPGGYFEQLQISVPGKNVAPAKVVRMGVRKTILRYAAAAVVTGLLAVSALFVYNNNKTIKPDAETVQLMAEAKKINQTNSFDKELNSISDADIVNYLEDKGQDVNAALVASLTDDDKKLPDAADYIIDESTLDNMLKELDLNN